MRTSQLTKKQTIKECNLPKLDDKTLDKIINIFKSLIVNKNMKTSISSSDKEKVTVVKKQIITKNIDNNNHVQKKLLSSNKSRIQKSLSVPRFVLNIGIKHYENKNMTRVILNNKLFFSKIHQPNIFTIFKLKCDILIIMYKNSLIGFYLPSTYMIANKELKCYLLQFNNTMILTQYDIKTDKRIVIDRVENYQHLSLSWMNNKLIGLHIKIQ